MRNDELRYANDARGAIENHQVKGAWLLLLLIAAAMIAAIIWASWATVERTTTGIGKVIPSRQTQRVESLEPGIVTEILVKEGDYIEEGQNLIRVDDTGASARFGELHRKQQALMAEQFRLKIQADRGDNFEIPKNLSELEFSFYQDQEAVFDTQHRRLREKIAVLNDQLIQRRQNLEEANANYDKQSEALKLAERELELTRKLYKKKAVTELEFLRIQRLVIELRGDLAIMSASKARIVAEVSEVDNLISSEVSSFLAVVRERMSHVNAELSVVAESMRAAEDRVQRTVLKSPVSGTVNQLNIATIGEVVQGGATLVEIIPVDDRLLIETKIRPQDIAFIRPGLKATIRLSAYDYTKYGTLAGTVERIGADTITDENRETFYQVIVATEERQDIPDQIEIIPGMVATVDITAGNRTVLEYLMKPVLRVRDQALRSPN